jgi:hypothetical protein
MFRLWESPQNGPYQPLGINVRAKPSRTRGCIMNEEKSYCSVCGKKISTEDYESYDGLCWECWDDQMKKNANSKKT